MLLCPKCCGNISRMLLIFTNITSSLCAFLVLNVAWKARSVSLFLSIKVNAKESVTFFVRNWSYFGLFGAGIRNASGIQHGKYHCNKENTIGCLLFTCCI